MPVVARVKTRAMRRRLVFLWVGFTTCPFLLRLASQPSITGPAENASMQIYEEINPCDDAVDLVLENVLRPLP